MNLTGQVLRILPFLIVFAISIATAKDVCPPPELLYPCVCEQDIILTSIRCSNITSMETLVSVFQRSGDRRFKYFALDHSSLMYLPAASLTTKRFKGLLLGNVTLTSLFDKLPSISNELEMLSLNQAFLQRGVRWDLLQNLAKLTFLQITKTEVKSLGKAFMKNVGDKKIANLYFFESKTVQLDDQVFASLTELRELHIVRNKIKTLKRSMFARPAAIRNFIFPENEIETLPEDIFSDMPFLKTIILRNNRISEFTEPTFGGIFNQLVIFSFEKNPVTCDCSIEWFLSREERRRVLGTCDMPADKRGRQISDINKDDLAYCHQSRPSGSNMIEAIING